MRTFLGAVATMGLAMGCMHAQTVIPLINEAASGQLGISLRLGTSETVFTYILDTGSAGFFTARGTTSAWAGAVRDEDITPETFDISYGTGALNYQGKVAHTSVTFTDVNGVATSVSGVRLGVITNEPYANWNANINNMDGGAAAPIPPESESTHLFYGTFGAGLYQTGQNNGTLGSVIGQMPLEAGLTKGFLIHTGGALSTSATLTIGLSQAEMDSFPIKIQMNPTTGSVTNDNGTSVNLYPEAQATAKYTIISGQDTYTATANLIMDTGGLGTHITTGADIHPPTDLRNDAGNAVIDGASFATEIEGISLAQALDWLIDPTGQTEFVDKVGITDGSAAGSLNSGIALFYNYDVYFDTENGIIGLRPIPEPATSVMIGSAILGLLLRLRVRGGTDRA